jgi:hypothetical protein
MVLPRYNSIKLVASMKSAQGIVRISVKKYVYLTEVQVGDKFKSALIAVTKYSSAKK